VGVHASTDQAAHVFEALIEAGGLRLCGLHRLDSCRLEKACRHFGPDITDEDHVLDAGLGFAVRLRKPEFIGRDAVLRKREAGLDRRLVQFRMKDPEPLLFHNEAILRDGRIVGPVTSGAYGHWLGGAIGLGHVPCRGESEADVLGSRYEVEVAGVRHEAVASLQPMHDPKSERVRG
jgi:4-methylaminobutanoate oxidase (formaldehyde-forming)